MLTLRERGSGFCVYADIAIAIASLRQSGQLTTADSIAIIDFDAHQGNGLARIFAGVVSPLENPDRTVHILDMYNLDIYPQDRQAVERIDCDLPLASGTRDAEYLDKLQQHLPSFLSQIDSLSERLLFCPFAKRLVPRRRFANERLRQRQRPKIAFYMPELIFISIEYFSL